jgi:hypothetical protein
MKALISENFNFERDGVEIEGYIEGYVIYNVDKNYGEDADGKRGIKKIFVEDIQNLQAFTKDGEDLFLTQEEYDNACEILTRKFFE